LAEIDQPGFLLVSVCGRIARHPSEKQWVNLDKNARGLAANLPPKDIEESVDREGEECMNSPRRIKEINEALIRGGVVVLTICLSALPALAGQDQQEVPQATVQE